MPQDDTAPAIAAQDDPGAARQRLHQLAACPECAAQYDVTELETGARFRCSCGRLIRVPEARSHEATVVRCSSCGGPRQDRRSSCAFCGADFTLHERDLHTICPGCASRISDRGRFCHSCGLAIAPQGPAGLATELACPACEEERKLSSRRLGGHELAILECNHCAGMWLGSEVFRLLEERARERQTASASPPAAAAAKATRDLRQPSPGTRMYRPCPSCAKLMNRNNYGRRSGVIVDSCAEHGLWFDRDELETILRWVRDGGLARADRIEREKRRDEERAKTRTASPSPWLDSSPTSRVGGGVLAGRMIERLLDFLLDFRK